MEQLAKFFLSRPFQPSLMFADKAGAFPNGARMLGCRDQVVELKVWGSVIACRGEYFEVENVL